MDNNGWPGEPGVPLNPERDGYHWCERDGGLEPRFWSSGQQLWAGSRNSWISPKMLLALFGYAGPCLTPAEVEARIVIARKDALEKCILICDAVARANRVEYPEKWKDRPEGIPHEWQRSWETCAETAEDIAAEIRALGEKE